MVAALFLLLTACSSTADEPNDSELNSATITVPAESEENPAVDTSAPPTTASTTTIAETTTTAEARIASDEAQAFKQLAPDLVGVSDGVTSYVAALDPVRIDDLAESTCGTISLSMSDSELGVKGLSAYDGLPAEEQAAIGIDDWVVFYGAIIGFFCPEKLPEVDLEATPAEGSEVERFRAIVTELSGVSAEAEAFVTSLTDERVDELQTIACEATSGDMTTEEFGVVIVESYEADLTPAETDAIGLAGYSELYGTMIGWFCPGKLPR